MLNVIALQSSLDSILESGFIRDCLLGGLGRPVRVLPLSRSQAVPMGDNLLYLSCGNDFAPAIKQAVGQGHRNIGVFHMGDEVLECDRSWYPQVDYVIRNYYHPEAFVLPAGSRCRTVTWVANGYRYGIGPRDPATLVPFSARSNPLFFVGLKPTNSPAWYLDVLPERQAMFDVVARHRLPGQVLATEGFGQGLGAASYAAWMENSRFALVPRGRADETIRLFDAFELGAIPITLAKPYLASDQAMAGAPVEVLESWDELPACLAAFAARSDRDNDIRQRACIDWWQDFKRHQQRRVAEVINGARDAASVQER